MQQREKPNQARLDATLSKWLEALSDLFPAGCGFSLDRTAGSRGDAYLFGVVDGRICFFPRDVNAEGIFHQLRIEPPLAGHGHRGSAGASFMERLAAVEISGDPHGAFPMLKRPLAEVFVFAFGNLNKQILLYFEKSGGTCIAVAKRALNLEAARLIRNEFETLSALRKVQPPVSPKPLAAMGRIEDVFPAAALQSAVQGPHIRPRKRTALPDDLLALLKRMGGTDDLSILDMGSSIQRDMARARLPDEYGRILKGLLDRARSERRMRASIYHGDFRAYNLIQAAPAGAVAIDWENSEPTGLAFMDAARFLIEPFICDPRITTLQQLFAAQGLTESLDRARVDLHGPDAPALGEFVALHMAKFFVDLIAPSTNELKDSRSFPSKVLAMLKSDWPEI